MNESNRFRVPILRNLVEYAALIAWWLLWAYLVPPTRLSPLAFSVIVIAGCWFKTIFFGTENLRQLYDAARDDLSHHRFFDFDGDQHDADDQLVCIRLSSALPAKQSLLYGRQRNGQRW